MSRIPEIPQIPDGTKKEALIWSSRFFRLGSITVTEWLARHYGYLLHFQYVGGYPRSGTTWIAEMVAHYMNIPFVDDNYFPNATANSLVHNHWNYHPSRDHSIQVIRDGRDVMTSLYWFVMKAYVKRTDALSKLDAHSALFLGLARMFGEYANLRRRVMRAFGESFDPWDIETNLPRFIEEDFRKPFLPAVKRSWKEHAKLWRAHGKETIFIKYEDALRDPFSALKPALESLSYNPCDDDELRYTINRFSFQKRTGREPGVENREQHARKGVSGDWENYFSVETAQVFDHLAGDLLIELGYETDHDWVQRVKNKP